MNIEQENLNKLEQIQQQLASNVASDPSVLADNDPSQDPAVQEGKETLKQALYLFGEMGNGYLKGLHERLGVDEKKLSTATDMLGESISKHLNADAFKYSIEASTALYIGTIAVQQYRIYQEVRDEIIQRKNEQESEDIKDIRTASKKENGSGE